jgi:hypothetical protein
MEKARSRMLVHNNKGFNRQGCLWGTCRVLRVYVFYNFNGQKSANDACNLAINVVLELRSYNLGKHATSLNLQFSDGNSLVGSGQ